MLYWNYKIIIFNLSLLYKKLSKMIILFIFQRKNNKYYFTLLFYIRGQKNNVEDIDINSIRVSTFIVINFKFIY